MNAEEIKECWDKEVPVIYKKPNQIPIECKKIDAVIYRKHPKTGKRMVSCEVRDTTGSNAVMIVRANYLEKEHSTDR